MDPVMLLYRIECSAWLFCIIKGVIEGECWRMWRLSRLPSNMQEPRADHSVSSQMPFLPCIILYEKAVIVKSWFGADSHYYNNNHRSSVIDLHVLIL